MTNSKRYLPDGTRLKVEGAGPPLVLVHGVGMDLTMWDEVVRALTNHFTLIRFDMIGHGESAKPPGPYRLWDFVIQVLRIADELQLGKFDLVGFSMGGLVAQGFATSHSDRLRHLILINTVHNRTPEERAAIVARVADVLNGGYPVSIEAAIERWFTPAFCNAHRDIVEAVRSRMMANNLDAYAAAYQVFATADAELVESAMRIICPTLVITGAEDQRSTVLMAKALVSSIPQARLSILEGLRHLTPLEAPAILAAMISEFLQQPFSASPRKATQ